MSQVSTPISSSTKLSYPTDNCPKATEKYYALVFVSMSFEKGSYEFETACLRYKWHIKTCDKCQKGLGK